MYLKKPVPVMFLKGSSTKSFPQGWAAGARMWANLNSTYIILVPYATQWGYVADPNATYRV